jgi:HEAT repeat protein
MIKKQSDDPDVEHAAKTALAVVQEVLTALPKAEAFDYGGHELHIGDYEVCGICTSPIAEAQQAHLALQKKADEEQDSVIKEHLMLAAKLFKLEAEEAIVRAEFHNGISTEPILNIILGYIYDRSIHDEYKHSHGEGA